MKRTFITYKQFVDYGIDLAPLGVEYGDDTSGYFCTPKGARVIGWAGVDGIHFCFVRGFSDMVFIVSPMNAPGAFVHPVARNFSDFLRLLLACGNSAPLEQAWAWDEAQFDAFLENNPPTDEQHTVLCAIREKLCLRTLVRPFAYLKELQAEFDYSRICFAEDYYDVVYSEPELPLWKVYFEGGFWGRKGNGRPGIEIPVQCRFDWDGQAVYVPSVYSCAKGLVIDLCVMVSAKEVHAFMDKWELSLENDGSDLTDEQQMQAEAENPLAISFTPDATMNGRTLHYRQGCTLSWNPCVPEGNNIEAKGVLEYYDLDPTCGWSVSRYSFPWGRSRRPQIRSLSLTLQADTVSFLGENFKISSPGENVAFTHPKTGARHTLTVQEYERQQIPQGFFGDDVFEYPRYYTAMSYTLFPDLPEDAFSLTDSVQSDHPRGKQKDPIEPQVVSDCMVLGVIGGADRPTTVVVAGEEQGNILAACSSLHFSPEYEVEWRMVFHEKTRSDVLVELV